MKKHIFLVIVIGILLTGCASLKEFHDPERLEQVTGIDKHSTYPAVRRESFERINLLELIDPEDNAAHTFATNWKRTEREPDDTEERRHNKMGAKYDLVLAHFRQRKDISDDEKRKLRNSIQERMLSVSISRCNVFKTYIRRDQANVNFGLGMATTVAGALGAVLPGADAARYLAGASGLFSGVRAEYNQAYYSNLAANVIAKGIETKQELVYRRIQTEGQTKSIEAYPLEAAIKDAIYFDGLCSVVAGLDQAAASVDATNEPGLDAAMRTVLRARFLKEAADMPKEKLLDAKELKSFKEAGAELGLSLVGTVRDKKEDDTDLYVVSIRMVDRVNTAADNASSAIEKAGLERKNELLDPINDADQRKLLADKAPKQGDIAKKTREQLTAVLLSPLKLDACFAKLASGALKQRIDAVEEQIKADTDSKRANASYKVNEAARAVATARERLLLKEKLVKIEIEKYQGDRIKEINKAEFKPSTEDAKKPDKDNPFELLINAAQQKPADPSDSKEPSCN